MHCFTMNCTLLQHNNNNNNNAKSKIRTKTNEVISYY